MGIHKLFIALIAWLLLTSAAQAASWYTIELVLFSRGVSPAASGEIWPHSSGNLNWQSEQAGNYAPASPGRLSAAKLALNRRGLTPLVHTAWRQPVYNRSSARPFYIRSDRDISPGTPLLEGMVKVSVNRYLHVDLDLLLRGAATGTDQLPGGFQTFRFNEHRRMRSKELHYIDHPLMGMLIQITPSGGSDSSQQTDDDVEEEAAKQPPLDEPTEPEESD